MQSETGERSSRKGERGLPARCVSASCRTLRSVAHRPELRRRMQRRAAGCPRSPRSDGLTRVDGEHLTAFVVATGRACGMRGDSAAALRALVQLRSYPTVRCLARAQPHLRDFAFWNSHKSGLGKQEMVKRQQGSGFRLRLALWSFLKSELRNLNHYSNFSLSRALQSGLRAAAFASAAALRSCCICGAGQTRSPVLSQRG